MVSLPFSHPSLKELNKLKEQKDQKIEKYLLEDKNNLLHLEKVAVLDNKRFRIYSQILNKNFNYCKLDQRDNNEYEKSENINTNFFLATRSYILNCS